MWDLFVRTFWKNIYIKLALIVLFSMWEVSIRIRFKLSYWYLLLLYQSYIRNHLFYKNVRILPKVWLLILTMIFGKWLSTVCFFCSVLSCHGGGLMKHGGRNDGFSSTWLTYSKCHLGQYLFIQLGYYHEWRHGFAKDEWTRVRKCPGQRRESPALQINHWSAVIMGRRPSTTFSQSLLSHGFSSKRATGG